MYPEPMIITNPVSPNYPLVIVTAPKSSRQTRICFNGGLARQAGLQDVPHMAIDFDGERRRVTFISTSSDQGTYRLTYDGGNSRRKNTATRVLSVSKTNPAAALSRPLQTDSLRLVATDPGSQLTSNHNPCPTPSRRKFPTTW